MANVEVEEETDALSTETKVRQQLGAVYGMDGFDRLQLHNDSIFHQEVNPIACIDPQAVVLDWQWQLRRTRIPRFCSS